MRKRRDSRGVSNGVPDAPANPRGRRSEIWSSGQGATSESSLVALGWDARLSAGASVEKVGRFGGAANGAANATGSGPTPAGATAARTANAAAAPVAPSPNFVPADAFAYRAAADTTKAPKATFGAGPVGDVLCPDPSGQGYRLSDYEVPSKFFRPPACADWVAKPARNL
jgi:hypothetical protein